MKENMKKEIIKRVLSSLLAFVLIFSELSGVIPAYASADAGVQEQAIYQAEETPEADETFQAEEVSEADETVQPEQTPEASEGEEVSETDETVQAEETPEASEIAAADEDSGEEPVEDGDEGIMLLSDGDGEQAVGYIDISSYNGPLDIYSYYAFTDANGQINTLSRTYMLRGSKDALNIGIGDHPVEGNADTAAKSGTIQLSLDGINLTTGGAMTIYPVYSASNTYYTEISTTAESTLQDVVLEANAKVSMTLNHAVTVHSITLGQGAELNIILNGGSLTVTEDISGDVTNGTGLTASNGTLTVAANGTGGTLTAANISVGTLSISGGTVQTCDGTGTLSGVIRGWDSVSVSGGTIQNTAFFGYSSSADKTLSFTNGTVSNVTTVGHAADFNGTFTLSGADNASFSNCTVYCDYPITYSHNGVELNIADAPVSYRVKFTNGVADANASTIGYHTASGYTALAEGATVTLPAYTEGGYAFQGWIPAEQTEAIIALPATAQTGNLALSAKMAANSVVVSYDLGYDPTEKTNDKDAEENLPNRTTTAATTVGGTLTLPTQPVRFGYLFQGWKITSANNARTLQADAAELTVAYADLTEGALTLEAQWKESEYSIQLAGAPDVALADQQISVDGGTTWQTFEALAAGNTKVNYSDEGNTPVLSFTQKITYGQTMGAYLKSIFGSDSSFPILKDSNHVKHFVQWINRSGSAVTAYSVFDNSGDGMLKAKTGQTLSALDAQLKNTATSITSSWNTTFTNTLTTDAPSGWEILVDGKVVTPGANGNVSVDDGSVVTYRTSASSPANFSYWTFVDSTGGSIYPQMQSVTAASQYIEYQFTMSGVDVTAAYNSSKQVYVDIAVSPITFAEDVSYNDRTGISGFWYDARMEKSTFDADGDGTAEMLVNGLTPLFGVDVDGSQTDSEGNLYAVDNAACVKFFYEYPFTTTNFYLTSKNAATQNQLTITNTANITLQACNLACRDKYLSDCVGTKINGVQMVRGSTGLPSGTANMSMSSYGNIVKDRTSHAVYTLDLKLIGSNTIGVITNDKIIENSNYRGKITLTGDGKANSVLTLGTFMPSEDYTTFNSLNIKKDETSQYDYLIDINGLYHYSTSHLTMNSVTVDAPSSLISCESYPISITGNDSGTNTIDVKSIYACGFQCSKQYVRVREDIVTTVHTLTLTNAIIVVDGNVIHNGGNGRSALNSSFLCVKGTVCDLRGTNVTDSTVIANTLNLQCGFTFSGNTKVITNAITGCLHNRESSYDSTTKRIKLVDLLSVSYGVKYPFLSDMSADSNSNSYNKHYFQGSSKTYLLGYYKIMTSASLSAQLYDLTITGTDSENPVSAIIAKVVDSDGDYNGYALTDTELQQAVSDSSASNSANECVNFGYTTIPDRETERKYVDISGSAQIYAAGNLTFYSDTTVQGNASVECYGTFSTMRDLTVTGGTIEASAVGNSNHLTMSVNVSGTVKRWQKASFSNCTLKTGSIGAVAVNHTNSSPSRSTLSVGDGVTLACDSDTGVSSDIYINYLYDDTEFSLPDDENNRPATLNFTATISSGTVSLNGMKLKPSTVQSFDAPIIKNVEPSEYGTWKKDDATGVVITQVNLDGTTVEASEGKIYEAEQLTLYAVKTDYELTISEGLDNVSGITATTSVAPDTTTARNANGIYTTYNVKGGDKVTLTLSGEEDYWAQRSVVWYKDNAGILHNVSDFSADGNTVSFTMPYAAAEVFVTDTLKLYLDWSDISFRTNGFAVEQFATGSNGAKTRRADSVFTYCGNYLVTEETHDKTTYCRMFVEDATFDNLSENKQNITLKFINQQCDSVNYGTDIVSGAKLRFDVDEDITLAPVNVPVNSDFTIRGVNNDLSKDKVIAQSHYSASGIGSVFIIASASSDVLVQDIRFTRIVNGDYFVSGGENVTFDHFTYSEGNTYSASYSGFLSYNGQNVTLKNSSIKMVSLSYGGGSRGGASPFYVRNLTIDQCDINYTLTNDGWFDLFSSISGSIDVKDSNVTIGLPQHDSGDYLKNSSGPFCELTVEGDSVLNISNRVIFNQVILKDTAQFNVTATGDAATRIDGQKGYLFCRDISVSDQASLNTDYLFVSGYNTASFGNDSSLLTSLNAGNNLMNGNSYSGLVINGGTVTVNEFVGGDINGKVTVNGGVLNAKRVGTLGAVAGYSQHVPAFDEEQNFVYLVSKVPSGGSAAVVSIIGGTVNVSENGYLGGMNATVNQTGGTVNLADGAVYGLTDDQMTTLKNSYSSVGDDIANHEDKNITLNISGGTVTASGTSATGSINAPYGTVTICEAAGADTRISVYNMKAENGSISISNAANGFTNPYAGADSTKETAVGVVVANELSAQNVSILSGAQVYALNAWSTAAAGTSGSITVGEDADSDTTHTSIYTSVDAGSFGINGDGNITLTTVHKQAENGKKQNVYGSTRVQVQYVLNDDTIDPATNSDKNPNSFVIGQTSGGSYDYETDGGQTYIKLQDPSRYGYVFDGWYEKADFSSDRVTRILTSNSKNLTLYAKWTAKTVTFSVNISSSDLSAITQDEEREGIAGTWDSSTGVFTYTATVTVPYREVIEETGSGQLDLADYLTKSHGFTYAQLRDSSYNSGQSLTLIAGSTKVSRDILDAYESKNAALTIYLVTLKKRSALLTFNINKTNGLPIDTAFNCGSGTESATVNTVKTRVDLGLLYAQAPGVGDGSGLMQPTAPGYTFTGWNTQADGHGTAYTGTETVTVNSPTTFYAIWQANTYTITFDAGESGVVSAYNAAAEAPADGSARTITATAVYDTKLDGGLTINGTSAQKYPTAWKKGYVFLGWTVSGGTAVTCGSSTVLNKTTFGDDLDVTKSGDNSALTLVAVYRKVKVTYVTDNGSWTDSNILTAVGGDSKKKSSYTSDALNYGDALPGLVENETVNAENYELLDSVTVEGNPYAVKSTTSGYYQTNKTYVGGDYRLTIQRKGFTFTGWYTSKTAAEAATETARYGTIPAYSDITLYAGWKTNSYTLTLYASKDGMTYENSKFVQIGSPASGLSVRLTLLNEINATYTIDYTNWPTRNQWYTSTESETDTGKYRYLLGFTFDALDPGDPSNTASGSKYNTYAQAVTLLLNNNALFTRAEGQTEGSEFYLPEDLDYGSSVISGTTVVPDYPTGSTIPMYAVYRERSLVFNEYYIDSDGITHNKVLASYPYNNWSNYPDTYSNAALTDKGYKLIKWSVNTPGLNSSQYPTKASAGNEQQAQTVYNNSVVNWRETASSMGTYDINVYTVYAAQVEVTTEQKLTAKSDPQTTAYDTFTYTVPASMQTGTVKYTLTDTDGSAYSGFELVFKADMLANKYNSDYAKKIAVTVTVKDKNNNIIGTEQNLTAAANTELLSGNSVAAGYKLVFTLYHSSVMTAEEAKSFALTLNFYDATTGTYMEQFIKFDKITTKLVPSMYNVVYDADLPSTYYDSSKVTWNDFGVDGKRTVKTAYGSALLNLAAEVEGYSVDNKWYRTNSDGTTYSGNITRDFNGTLNLPVTAADNGTIYLKAKRSINTYTLTLDQSTLDRWDVRINGITDTSTKTAIASNNVEYHSTITFTQKSGTTQYAEMISLTPDPATAVSDTTSTTQLDLCATESSGSYSFHMPAKNETAAYNDVWTLYLEDGTIDITADKVTQHKASGNVERTWHGDYVILMDKDNNADNSATANTLNISGDLSDRKFSLGNLKITSNDSIKLAGNAKAVLTAAYGTAASTVIAKNIQVPETAELTVNGVDAAKTSKLELTPNTANYAAIGGVNGANGKITLKDLTLEAAMSAPSRASVIGPGNQTSSGCGTVTVNNCAVTVKESSTASGAYGGAWIGGQGVASTTVTASTVIPSSDSSAMTGPYVLRGTSVTVENSAIGTDTAKVTDPIYADGTLTITNSTVKQNITTPLGATSAIGAGTIKVTNSTIASEFSGSGSSDSLYAGTMKLMDKKSDVTIKGVHLADVNNGDIIITASGIKQNSNTENHTGDYRILSSFSGYSGGAEITVNSLAAGAKVAMDTCTVGNININADTPVTLNGNVTVSGTATIAEGKKLNVTAGGKTLTFTGNTPLEYTAGTFAMEGGSLAAAGKAVGSDNLTIDLKNVTVGTSTDKISSLIAKILTLDGCTVYASGNVGSNGVTDGVTTVSIKGNTTIDAAIIGALGTQSSTFTFVTISDSFTFKGTLQRDLYRLNYNLDSAYKQSNPTVARVSETHTDAVAYTTADETMTPATLADATLKSAGTSSFRTWYILDTSTGTAVPAAIKKTGTTETTMAGYTTYRELAAADIAYAAATDPSDGTKTLQVYSNMGMQGTCAITSGKLPDGFTGSNTSASVYTNSAWTADFTAKGTLTADSSYQLAFGQALPDNTMLTMVVEGTPDQVFYYKANSSETTVSLSDFIKMGTTNQKPDLLSGEAGSTVNDHFTLVADFSQASAAESSGVAVKLELVTGTGNAATVSDVGTQNLTYTLTARPASTITATGATVNVNVANDTELSGKKLYLLAQINNSGFTAPYTSTAKVVNGGSEIAGTWLGGNMLSFNLGNYEAGVKSYTYTISGLDTGSYDITWKICYGSASDTNTANHVLATSSAVTYAATKALPWLKVAVGDSNQKIAVNTAKVFTVTTDDGETVTAKVYKLSGSSKYTSAGSSATITGSGNTFTVTCSEAGTYRVEFSIKDSCMYDNVYYSFVVE